MFGHLAGRLVNFLVGRFSGLFLSISSSFSIASLLCALCIAITFLLLSRRPGKKNVKYIVMLRALFPRWLRRASFRADVWFLLLNLFASSILIGWTVISSRFIGDTVAAALTGVFGATPSSGANIIATASNLYQKHKLRRVYYSAFSPIPHGDGQTILREALLVADHNAYHLGALVTVLIH